MLRLERVCKSYRRGNGARVALRDVSLELGGGEIMGIFGPAAAGKTTLLRVIAGLEAPDSGRVSYHGEPLERMSVARRAGYLRREVGCVWNHDNSSEGMSALEHVMLPLLIDRCDHRSAEQRARKLLLACEVEQCIGLELRELSDGERQLVAIARALVSEPQLLLVDGAVASLSLLERETIMRLLAALAKEARLAVLVTGGEAIALPAVDTLYYMSEGKLVGDRPLSELGRVVRFPTPGSRRAAADA